LKNLLEATFDRQSTRSIQHFFSDIIILVGHIGAAAYNGLEQENRTNSMIAATNAIEISLRPIQAAQESVKNATGTTPNAAAAQPKLRLASHEDQLPQDRGTASRKPAAASSRHRGGTQQQIKKRGDHHQRTRDQRTKGPGGGRYLR